MDSTPDQMITVPKAARRFNLGLRQLRRAIDRKQIPVFDIGAWPRVRPSDVRHWVEQQRRR